MAWTLPTELTSWRAHAAAVLSDTTATPLVPVEMRTHTGTARLLLKLEGCTAAGSSKGRTARALLRGLLHEGKLTPRTTLVESSSGNLAVALAQLTTKLGLRFTAVIDPRTTPEIRRLLENTSAAVETVRTPGPDGSFLHARRQRVQEIESNGAIWTNQYANVDNPLAHHTETGPELLTQCGAPPDFVFAAVSTGGTVSGLSRYLAAECPTAVVVAVDVIGSAALGGKSGPRLITGIGSSRRVEFPLHDNVVRYWTHQNDAIAHARKLRTETGIGIGGSGGAILAACAQYLRTESLSSTVVCLCADGAERYASSLYNDDWLTANDVHLTSVNTEPVLEYQRVGTKTDLP